MTIFRFSMIMLVVIAVIVAGSIFFAFRTHSDNVSKCEALNGHWLERYQLCISDDSVIKIPAGD